MHQCPHELICFSVALFLIIVYFFASLAYAKVKPLTRLHSGAYQSTIEVYIQLWLRKRGEGMHFIRVMPWSSLIYRNQFSSCKVGFENLTLSVILRGFALNQLQWSRLIITAMYLSRTTIYLLLLITNQDAITNPNLNLNLNFSKPRVM